MADNLAEVDASVFADFEFDDEPVQAEADPASFADFEFDDEPAQAAVDPSAFADFEIDEPSQPEATDAKPGYWGNVGRAVGARVTELAGAEVELVGQVGAWLDEKASMGGFVFGENGFPRYAGPEEWKALQKQGMTDLVKSTGEGMKGTNFGYEARHTWESTKKAWDEGIASGMAETLAAMGESGAHSLADMGAAVLMFPGYIGMRAQEMGEARAKNKNKSSEDISDTIQALPAAVASAFLERIVPGKVWSSLTGKQQQKMAAEAVGFSISAMKHAVKDVAATAGKRGLQEAGTEAIQEGLIEYVGERWGTDAKIKAAEMLDAAAGGFVLGGGPGAALGTVESGFKQLTAKTREQIEREDRIKRFIEDENLELDARLANGEIIGPSAMAKLTDPKRQAERAEQLEKSGELARRYVDLKAPQDHEHDIRTFDETQKQKRFEQFITEQTLELERQIQSGEITDPAEQDARRDHGALVQQFEQMEASGEARQRYPSESYTDVALREAEQEIAAVKRATPKSVERIMQSGGDLADADMDQFDGFARDRIANYTRRYAQQLKVDPNENPEYFKELVNQAVELEHSGHLEVLARMPEDEQRQFLQEQQRETAYEHKDLQDAAKGVDVVRQGIIKHLGAPTADALQKAHEWLTNFAPANTAIADALVKAANVTPDQVLAPQADGSRETTQESTDQVKTPRVVRVPAADLSEETGVIQNLESVVAADQVTVTMGVKLNQLKSSKQLPEGLKKNALRDEKTKQIIAAFDPTDGTLHVVGPQDADQLVRTALSEVAGKKGVRTVAGKKLDIPLTKVHQMMDAQQRADYEDGSIENIQERRRKAAENFVEIMSEVNPSHPALQPVIDGTRRWLKQSFGDRKFTNRQILNLWQRQSVRTPPLTPKETSTWERRAKALGRQPTPKIPEGFAPKRTKPNPPKPKPKPEEPAPKPAKKASVAEAEQVQSFIQLDEIVPAKQSEPTMGEIDTSNVLGRDFVKILVARDGLRVAAAGKLDSYYAKLFNKIPEGTSKVLSQKMKDRKGGGTKNGRERLVAEEYARQLARHAPQDPLTADVVQQVGAWLKKSYPYAKFTESEILSMIADAPASQAKPTPAVKPQALAEAETETEAEAPVDAPAEAEPTEYAEPLTPKEAKAREASRKAARQAKDKLKKAERTAEQTAAINRVTDQGEPHTKRLMSFLRRHFRGGGNMPRHVFDAWVRNNGEKGALDLDTSMHISAMEMAAWKAYRHQYFRLSDKTKRDIKSAIQQKITDPEMPEPMREATAMMREYLDNLSERYATGLRTEIRQLIKMLEDGSPDVETISKKLATLHAIERNKGWLHRSYEVFDNPDWHNKVDGDVVHTAIEYLADKYAQGGEQTAEHRRRAEHDIAVLIQKDHKYSNFSSMVRDSKLGAMNLDVLMRRNDIPWQIRAVMGEYQDPRLAFAQSATKLGQMVFNQEFLNYLRDTGMNVFLFEKHNAPAWANQQIAAEGSETYAPLNGLYTSKEFLQALKDQTEVTSPDSEYAAYIKLTGFTKYSLTVLGIPAGPLRNFASGAFQMIASGHSPVHMITAAKVVKGYFANRGESIAYLRMLQKEGIIHDTARGGALKELQNDSNFFNRLFETTGMRWPKTIVDFVQHFYEFGDDFWKIVGYEAEKARLKRWGKMTEEQAHAEARDRTRNQYLTYSQVGRSVKLLRRNPIISSFPSFGAEVLRTQYNQVGYLVRDLKQYPAIGAARLVGLSLAWGGLYAIGRGLMAWNDVDDDEDWAVRQLGATWDKTGHLMYTGRDETGRALYIDMTYYNIYGTFWRIAAGLKYGTNGLEKFKLAATEGLSPLLGMDVTTKAFLDVIDNRKDSGAPIYNPEDPDWWKDAGTYLGKTLLPSGPRRLYEGAKQTRSPDYKSPLRPERKDPADAWRSFAGVTITTADPEVSLYYRLQEHSFRHKDINRLVTTQFRNLNDNSMDDLLEAQDKARMQYYKSMADLARAVRAAKIQGMPVVRILEMLDEAGLPEALAAGRIDRFSLPEKSLESTIEKLQDNFARAGVSPSEETMDLSRKTQFMLQDNMEKAKEYYLDEERVLRDEDGRKVTKFDMPDREDIEESLPATKDLKR